MLALTTLHSATQVALTLSLVTALFSIPLRWLASVCIACVVLSAACSSDRGAFLRRAGVAWLPLAVGSVLVAVAGAPSPDEHLLWAGWHVAVSRERAAFVVTIALRTAALIALGLRFADWLTPTRLRRLVADLRLPPVVARLGISALAARSLVAEAAGGVARAQQLRGVQTKGRLLARLRTMPLFVGPLATSLLIEAAVRSAALERRGYERYVSDVPPPNRLRLGDYAVLALALSVLSYLLMR